MLCIKAKILKEKKQIKRFVLSKASVEKNLTSTSAS